MDEDFATAMQSGARELADQTILRPVRDIRAQGDQRRRRRAGSSMGLLLVTAVAVGIGIVHFGGPGRAGLAPPTTIPRTSDSPVPDHTTTNATPKISETPSSEGAPATEPASVPNCTMAQLQITLGQGDSGLGHSGLPLLFRNIGSTVCRLHGYPEVKAFDIHDHVIAQARQTPNGYMGGLPANSTQLPTVDLSPGQSASALVETLNFNASDGSACTTYGSLLVTAPNETHSISLHVTGGGCSDLQIHPVVPGDTGRSR